MVEQGGYSMPFWHKLASNEPTCLLITCCAAVLLVISTLLAVSGWVPSAIVVNTIGLGLTCFRMWLFSLETKR